MPAHHPTLFPSPWLQFERRLADATVTKARPLSLFLLRPCFII